MSWADVLLCLFMVAVSELLVKPALRPLVLRLRRRWARIWRKVT